MNEKRNEKPNPAAGAADAAFTRAAGRHVLFITTKNTDYIRNVQEISALRRTAAKVTVLGFPGGNYPTRLARLYGKLAFMSLRPYDLIVIGFAPQLVLPLFRRRFRGREVWVDFFLSLYDTLVDDRKKIRPGGGAARLLRALDRSTLLMCRRAITDTRADADYFARQFGIDRRKIEVCYLEADAAVYYPRPAAHRPGAPFTVLYFGSILPLQGVDVILQSARLLASDRILWDLIGPLPAGIREEFGKLPHVRLTPWLPQAQLAERIAAADLCLAGHFSGEIGKASRTIPGKAYIYRAMDKPMILGDNPANRELFHEDAHTFFVKMGDPRSLAECIRTRMAETDFRPPAP